MSIDQHTIRAFDTRGSCERVVGERPDRNDDGVRGYRRAIFKHDGADRSLAFNGIDTSIRADIDTMRTVQLSEALTEKSPENPA